MVGIHLILQEVQIGTKTGNVHSGILGRLQLTIELTVRGAQPVLLQAMTSTFRVGFIS